MSVNIDMVDPDTGKEPGDQRPDKKKNSPLKQRYYKTLNAAKYTFIGQEANEGLLFKIFLYIIFISTSYIYLNPILKMVATMIMSMNDLIDPTVTWIPSSLYLGNLVEAWKMLDFTQSFRISIIVSLATSVFHVLSCGLAGYALARLEFPFKKITFGLLMLAFIIPPQVIILPTIIAYTNLGLQGNYLTLIIPSILGFGVKGALFVIIFRQFFMTQPKELEEAARIDGASAFKFYTRIMFPLARPAILVVFLFSFVWTWNDTYHPRMFLTGADKLPLASKTLQLDTIINSFIDSQQISPFEADAIKMAASFLIILPLLLLFLFFQNHFVESVERTGLVE